MYSEFAARNGEFGGYVKPFINDVKIAKWNKDDENIRELFWKKFAGLGTIILKNKKSDALATKIDISGKFDDPHLNKWRAISLLLRNAFTQALEPAIENTISINNVEGNDKRTFLEKVFDKKDKNNNK